MLLRSRIAAAMFVALLGVASAQTRNVLLVIGDDMGVDLVNAYHAVPEPGHTPVLDGLAADGVLFRNAWGHAVCSPARAAMILGRQSYRHGIGRAVGNVIDTLALDAGDTTLAHLVAPVATPLAMGKWHLNLELDQPLLHPLRSGFQHYRGNMQILPGFISDDYYHFEKNVDGVLGLSTTYSTTDIVNDALDFIAATPEPWFVWMATNAPHAPFHKPPPELHTFNLPASVATSIPLHVKAVVEAMDTELGRLLGSMDPAVRANTVVIFTTDNGTTKHATVAPFIPAHAKDTVYEGGLKVPLIIQGPGVAQGAECEGLVSNCDLYATIAEIFGRAHEEAVDSLSLLPYFTDPAQPSLRTTVYSEHFEPPGFGPYTRYDRAIREARYKLIHRWSPSVDSTELYDLETDPFEQVNLLNWPPLDVSAQAGYDALAAGLVPEPAAWNGAGYGVFGVAGRPCLSGTGSLEPETAMSISLAHAAPLEATTVFIGVDWIAKHFRGGILGPSPDIALAGIVTDSSGTFELDAHWPAGIPSGFTVYMQAWLSDATAEKGVAASNNLIATAR
jgi:arylsulfatase A-like enzyme